MDAILTKALQRGIKLLISGLGSESRWVVMIRWVDICGPSRIRRNVNIMFQWSKTTQLL